MKILAVDPGMSCAYAASAGQFGKWDFSRASGDPEGLPLVLFYKRLYLFVGQHEIEVLAYEKVFQMQSQKKGRGVQYGWETVMLMVAAEYRLELKSYWPSNLKKRATGKGNADKDQMRAQFIADHGPLIEERGIDVDDHDLVDALWILFLARQDCQ